MVFLNYKELPWYWFGFDWFPFAALMVLVVSGLLAFRSRVNGVYLSITTQALTFAMMLTVFRNDMGLGGNSGLTNFKNIRGFNVQAQGVRVSLFVIKAIARFMTVSAYGKILIAVRDGESRTRFLGYRPEHYKTLSFAVSEMMAGVIGRSTCRRSAASIPENSHRPTRSRR